MDNDDTRLLQPINISITSTEKGGERFNKPYVLSLPETYHWRNNLTALSHRYNLYFVATGAHIAVYVPSFPFQKIGSQPALSIPPTLANPTAYGYIGPDKPHTINHLIVGDLGEAEIILACTDSGNVTAYHTKSIQEAVRTSSLEASEILSTNNIGIRAFFSQWVFESAWGLAIHKHARMIAVSANTPYHEPSIDQCAKITVFAFALSSKTLMHDSEREENVLGDGDDTGWHPWQPEPNQPARPDRRRNYKIVLAGAEGHLHNIPNVSFIQSEDVLHDQWLLSTDINGAMKMWQIWLGHCYKTWDFSDQPTGTVIPWRDRRRQSGWNVTAVDPMAFRAVETVEEFCGWHKAPQYHGHRGAGASYDITNIARLRIPGTSQFHPALRGGVQDDDPPADEDFTEQIFQVLQETGRSNVLENGSQNSVVGTGIIQGDLSMGGLVENIQVDRENRSPEVHQSPTTGRSVSASSADPDETPTSLQEDLEEENSNRIDSDQQSLRLQNESGGDSENAESTSTSSQVDSEVHEYISEDALLQDSILSDTAAMVSQNRRDGIGSLPQTRSWTSAFRKLHPRVAVECSLDPQGSPPRVPMIHCTTSHVRLLADARYGTPHVFCAQILKQHLPPVIEGTHHALLDRLNLIQTIPELGVVIIGSQIGRCAVCSLTRKGKDGDFGFRVDWVLPTKAQERAGLRPLQDLLGIAAGPIQGRMVRKKANDATLFEEKVIDQSRPVDFPTSFDPYVVLLADRADKSDHEPSIPDNAANLRQASSNPGSLSSKRKRSHSQNSIEVVSQAISNLRIEQRPWRAPIALQPWAGTENSRRYRLMLTYTDQTVLTYELSREPSDTEIGTIGDCARKNLRNRPLF